jgi:hypothetical protein
MILTQQEDEVLSAAIAGVSRIAEHLATFPAEDRSRALEAAEKSYRQTAHALGYKDADAELWASEIMWRLRMDLASPPLSLADGPTSPPFSGTLPSAVDRRSMRR